MRIPIPPFAELKFTWTFTLSAQKVFDVARDGRESEAIRIEQTIEFNGDQQTSFRETPASDNNHGQLKWRLDYLKTHLERKLAQAVASLNREAFAFTDFIDKAVTDPEMPVEITERFLAALAEAAEKQALAAIQADGEEQIREAKERFNRAKMKYMRDRFEVVKAVCDEIKLQHDYLKSDFEKGRGVGTFDQKVWESIWLKRAPRKHAIPDEILRLFAQDKTAAQIANLIVGLELNHSESTVEKYKKPSARAGDEKRGWEREVIGMIRPEIYGSRPESVRLETSGKKSGPKNSRSRGKKE